MKRYGMKFRVSTYQEGQFYKLLMIGRKAVAPGERASKVVLDSRLCTPVFGGAILTPMLLQQWLFYVPFRLLWDQWVDFIALDDAVTQVPVTTVAAPEYFDGTAAANRNVFARRAYKLIYNQFFGDEFYSFGGTKTWFADITADSDVGSGNLLIWDQFRSHLRERAYTPSTYIASVSGAQATINLDDLSRSLRDNRARRRQKMTGDKYVDTMRLMGVELDWRVQMAPEFLGSSQQVVWPTERPSTNPDVPVGGLGARAYSYDCQQQLVLKRPVMFAEHGILVALCGARPLLSMVSGAQDSVQDLPVEFFRPDTAGGPMDAAGGGSWSERNAVYLRGRNMTGLNTLGYAFQDAGAINDFYPAFTGPVPLPPVIGNQLAFFTDIAVGGVTPVPAGMA